MKPTHEQLLKLKLYLCGKLPENNEFYWHNDAGEIGLDVLDTELDYIARLVEEKMSTNDNESSDAAQYQEALWRLVNPGIDFNPHEVLDVNYLHNFTIAPWHQRALAMAQMEGVEL